jgi:hypothetical protein
MLKTSVLTDLQRGLEWLKTKSERKYGHAVWDVRCRLDLQKSHVFVTGFVLLPGQKSALRGAATGLLRGTINLDCEIEVLADTISIRKTRAGKPRTDLLNVYSRPLDCFSLKIYSERFLSTQATPYDHAFRILFEHKDWLLVQLIDGTLGWAQKQLIDVTNGFVEHPDVATVGLSSNLGTKSSDSSTVVETAKEYLGIRYVLGGVTKFGIDCSGLVQRVYKDALGIVLPKHSRDQISKGRPVLFKSHRPGDVVFFKARNGQDLHVGLMCEEQKVIHASRRNGSVTIDEITTLASTLDVIQLRRIETN